MAIVINGSGTVTGLAVGGLPDGTVDAGTLATDSVVTGKITDGTITNADISSSSTITKNVPVFRAKSTSNQTINQNTFTKVVLASETFDSNSWYNASTYRYTPQIEGYYQFHGVAHGGTGTLSAMTLAFYKNGTRHSSSGLYAGNNSWDDMGITHTDLIYMNGSSDYIEMFVIIVDTGSSTDIIFYESGNGSITNLSGFLVREA